MEKHVGCSCRGANLTIGTLMKVARGLGVLCSAYFVQDQRVFRPRAVDQLQVTSTPHAATHITQHGPARQRPAAVARSRSVDSQEGWLCTTYATSTSTGVRARSEAAP